MLNKCTYSQLEEIKPSFLPQDKNASQYYIHKIELFEVKIHCTKLVSILYQNTKHTLTLGLASASLSSG
jgi:hypothetical protein